MQKSSICRVTTYNPVVLETPQRLTLRCWNVNDPCEIDSLLILKIILHFIKCVFFATINKQHKRYATALWLNMFWQFSAENNRNMQNKMRRVLSDKPWKVRTKIRLNFKSKASWFYQCLFGFPPLTPLHIYCC